MTAGEALHGGPRNHEINLLLIFEGLEGPASRGGV